MDKKHATPQIFKDHIPARQMRAFLGNEAWKRIFTFTIVRNPWDRKYSMYHYREKTCRLPGKWDFRDYVLALGSACPNTHLFKQHAYRYGASDYVLGENGELIVDFTARYEDRSNDLRIIASRLKIDSLGELNVQAATPRNRHYSEFYDAQTTEIVRGLYKKDIELFGYEFDYKTIHSNKHQT